MMWPACLCPIICLFLLAIFSFLVSIFMYVCSPGETEGDRAAGLWKCAGSEEDTDPQWCPQRHAAVPPRGLWGEF